MDRPSLARGGNFDGGDADELELLKKSDIMTNIIPMIRGNVDRYGEKNPLHRTFEGWTSMPWLPSGFWVFENEEKMKDKPGEFYYSEATARSNLAFVGRDYIDRMRADLTPEIFDVEIDNHRVVRGEHLFYYNFDESKHVHEP